jgi:hypothetical protein
MAPLFVIVVIGCVAAYVLSQLLMTGNQHYPDFIVGYITFADYDKSAEQRWFLLGVAVVLLVTALLSLQQRRLTADTKGGRIMPRLRALYEVFTPSPGKHGEIFGWLIAGAALGRSVINGDIDLLTVVGGVTGAVLILSQRFAPAWFGRVEAGLLAGLGAFVSCVGIFTMSEVVWGTPPANNSSSRLGIMLLSSGIAAVMAAGIPSTLRVAVVRGAQIFAPVVLLKFLVLASTGPQGSVAWKLNPFGCSLLLALVLGWLVLNLLRWVRSFRGEVPLVSSGLLFGVATLWAFSLPASSTLSIDPYHVGELILPWHQLVELGQRPYFDFVPVQGLMSLSQGFVNASLYDGSVSNFRAAHSLLLVGVASFFVALVAINVGRGAALLLAPLALPSFDQFCLVGSSIVLLSAPRLLENPRRWLAAAVATLAVALCWNAPTGVALIIASAPLGMWISWRAVSTKERSFRMFLPALVVAVACLYLLPIRGVVSFVTENGPINTVQHALPWFQDWSAPKIRPHYFGSQPADRIVWESLRVGGWVLAVALLVSVQLRVWPLRSTVDFGSSAFLVGGALFALLLFPYSMGRIDGPPHLSRTGALSSVTLGFFVPAAFLYCERYLARVVIHPLLVGVLMGIPLAWKGHSIEGLARFPTAQAQAGSNLVIADSESTGMSNLGRGYVPSDVLDEHARLKQALSPLLNHGEGYVDLTNHTIQATLLNRRFLGIYAGANAVGSRIQRRIIERFEIDPPAVVLVHPLLVMDGASIPLRNYLIFRWLMRTGYQWYEDQGYGFLVHPRRVQERGLVINEDPRLWREGFIVPHLRGIPRAWGKSSAALKALTTEEPIDVEQAHATSGSKESPPGWFRYRGGAYQIDVKLTEEQLASPADYLVIEFERAGGGSSKPLLGVSYPDAPGGDTVLQFWGGDSPLIVPVGADPLWQRTRISHLRIHLLRARVGSVWRLRKAQLLRLKEP